MKRKPSRRDQLNLRHYRKDRIEQLEKELGLTQPEEKIMAPKREQEIERLRDQTLKAALDNLLKFIDPTNTDCAVSPEARREAAQYLDSWVAGPLASALNRQDLAVYRGESTARAEEYLAATRR